MLNAVTISKFLGVNTSRDLLGLIPGQLHLCQNYLFMPSGGLEERGGGARLSQAPSASSVVYGLGNYLNASNQQFLITAQGTDLYYYSGGWNALSLTLTASKTIRFEQAGYDADRALYACNGTDGVIEIKGSPPAASAVASSPTNATGLKLHKNLLFTFYQDTLYWTDRLDFDNWVSGAPSVANNTQVAPGVDGYIKALEVWGDALFIFKEYGVYVLPNADAADPVNEFFFLRTDAAIGTQSTDSVKRTKVGIVYLGSDNTVRLLSPNVTYSSNEYTLGGSGSPIISESIKDDLNELLDNDKKSRASAIVFEDKYILSFQSVNNGGTYNDLTYFADMSKWLQYPGIPQAQPYWGEFTGFNYDFYAIQTSSGRDKLYGAKGAVDGTVDGDVQETLNPSVNNDNSAAIDSRAILGWYPLGGEAGLVRLNQIYFIGQTENWPINLVIGAYKLGNTLPEDGVGINKTFQVAVDSGSVVGTAIVGTATVAAPVGVGSSVYRLGLRGHYVKVEMRNPNADQFNRINKLILYYRGIKNK